MIENVWDSAAKVLLKGFWGWSPAAWGTLSFANQGRRQTIMRQSTDPFIAVACVPMSAKDKSAAGKMPGFYLVSHQMGHRDEFTQEERHSQDVGRWEYGLKALAAFTFLPEYRIETYDLDPKISERIRATGTSGEWLDSDKIERLKTIPYVQVPVFGGPDIVPADIYVPQAKHGVKGGPINYSGYYVPGEPRDTPKELYVLELKGDAGVFLKSAEEGLGIFKIGLSISPETRLGAFRNTLPKGNFNWDLVRSTRLDKHQAYPSFEAALAGEDAIKNYLGSIGPQRWLGAEFYAASKAEMEQAWAIGRQAALNYVSPSPQLDAAQ